MKYITSVYVIESFYLPSTICSDVDTKVFVYFYNREFYLLNNLLAHTLISNNVVSPERVTINIAVRKATIISCSVDIIIESRQRGQYTRRNIHTIDAAVLLLYI